MDLFPSNILSFEMFWAILRKLLPVKDSEFEKVSVLKLTIKIFVFWNNRPNANANWSLKRRKLLSRHFQTV